jgi:predicted GTPase
MNERWPYFEKFAMGRICLVHFLLYDGSSNSLPFLEKQNLFIVLVQGFERGVSNTQRYQSDFA